jgi:EpsI family protein
LDVQQSPPLRQPLGAVIGQEIGGYQARDVTLSQSEAEAAGFDEYLMRTYEWPDASAPILSFSVYIAYYRHQTQGRTIHSPKNCLPGSGWQALTSEWALVDVDGDTETVNRYVLQREDERALVLYWYQGRGRVEASEYVVKFDLLRDAALRRRSEEALVRIVLPIAGDEREVLDLGREIAAELISALSRALPG